MPFAEIHVCLPDRPLHNTRLLPSVHASKASPLSFLASAHILHRSRNTNR